ncbi:MAG: precorrin-3B C(17)-methyltransferase [Planctomycetes bacterium]|nr:precorrin-3B C(17)-methyltransferase [Planctomycetota bacterium]
MVGIGPGSEGDITLRARAALMGSDLVVGYKAYLGIIKDLLKDKPTQGSGMGEEKERCRVALEEASKGKIVSLVSSGDPGVYGMAGLALELAGSTGSAVPIEVIPGVPASYAASALLGAPLAHDHAIISLSDLLTPWELIEKRLRLAAQGDFSIVLYNPKSSQRTWQIEKTQQILLEYHPPTLPVGIVKDAGRPGQAVSITTLDKMLEFPIDMTTIIIVGNSTTFVHNGFMATRRGYKL